MSQSLSNQSSVSGQPEWFSQAKAQGLLTPQAVMPKDESRPWAVVLLTAFGAWLAGLPLLVLMAYIIGGLFSAESKAFLLLGMLSFAASVLLLRAKELPLFLEQFAVPMMWAGAAAMAWSCRQFLPALVWASLLSGLLLGAALLLPGAARAWLRMLLGAASMVLLLFALEAFGSYETRYGDELPIYVLSPWMGVHLLAAVWVLWHMWGEQLMGRTANAPAFFAGWAVAVLGTLAWISGRTFLIGGSIEVAKIGQELTRQRMWSDWFGLSSWRGAISAMVVALGAWQMLAWFEGLSAGGEPGKRLKASVASMGVAAVLVAMAWFMPTLGAALLIGALALRAQQYLLAAFAACIAAWIVGGFYYQLAWPLATKAVILVGAATALAALSWWAHSPRKSAAKPGEASVGHVQMPWLRPALVLLAVLATLGIANLSIWQKEQLIAHGKSVYVRLAPVDPRSLMQGDYMTLDFAMPSTDSLDRQQLPSAQRPFAVGKLAASGELTLTRIALPGESIASDETKIELSPNDGRWILVTNAWFFKEGDAQRWEQARYGEFRVMPDGRALLVGMRDEKLQPIKP